MTEVDALVTKEEFDDLKAKGFKGVIVQIFSDPYVALNDSTQLVKFINLAKEENVNVILELKPGSTKKWFNKDAYNDYYIWARSKSEGQYPNNWVGFVGLNWYKNIFF